MLDSVPLPVLPRSNIYKRHQKINISVFQLKLHPSLGSLVPWSQTKLPRNCSAVAKRTNFGFRPYWTCVLALLFINRGLVWTVISLCLGFFICEMGVSLVSVWYGVNQMRPIYLFKPFRMVPGTEQAFITVTLLSLPPTALHPQL